MSIATGRRITTEEATVKTATVEIKALTIGGKQVTLAVFRQLQEEDIWDGEHYGFPLRGIPWGKVNYCPDNRCKKMFQHVHVVWQKGDELRRCTVPNFASDACVYIQSSHDRTHWSALFKSMEALDQLFIAV